MTETERRCTFQNLSLLACTGNPKTKCLPHTCIVTEIKKMTSLLTWFNKSSEYEIDGKKLVIKIIGTPEKPWFKADDVCKALGYDRTDNALRHVKSHYKSKLNDIVS